MAVEEKSFCKEPEDIFQNIYSQSRNPPSQTLYKQKTVPEINLFTIKKLSSTVAFEQVNT